MVKKTKEATVQEQKTVEKVCDKTGCNCSCASKLKTGTILVGGFAIIVATIWAMAANNWVQIPSWSDFKPKTGNRSKRGG